MDSNIFEDLNLREGANSEAIIFEASHPPLVLPRGAFETPIRTPGLFDGEIFAWLHEHGGSSPSTIISIDQKWGVIVRWKTSGSLVRMICGKWCLQINLESIGPGPEFRLPAVPQLALRPQDAKGNPLTVKYHQHLDVAPGIVTDEHCSIPYKLVTTLTYFDPSGKPGPIAGHVEGPIMQFYKG